MPGITAKYTVSQLSEEQKDYLPQFTDTLFTYVHHNTSYCNDDRQADWSILAMGMVLYA